MDVDLKQPNEDPSCDCRGQRHDKDCAGWANVDQTGHRGWITCPDLCACLADRLTTDSLPSNEDRMTCQCGRADCSERHVPPFSGDDGEGSAPATGSDAVASSPPSLPEPSDPSEHDDHAVAAGGGQNYAGTAVAIAHDLRRMTDYAKSVESENERLRARVAHLEYELADHQAAVERAIQNPEPPYRCSYPGCDGSAMDGRPHSPACNKNAYDNARTISTEAPE